MTSVWLSHYTQLGRKQNPITGNTDHGILPPLALLEGPSANLYYTPSQGEDYAHSHSLIPLSRGRGGTHCKRHAWAEEKSRKVVWFEILLPWSHHPWFHPSYVRDTSPYRQTPTPPAKWVHSDLFAPLTDREWTPAPHTFLQCAALVSIEFLLTEWKTTKIYYFFSLKIYEWHLSLFPHKLCCF